MDLIVRVKYGGCWKINQLISEKKEELEQV